MTNFRVNSPRTLREVFKPVPHEPLRKQAAALNHEADAPPLRAKRRERSPQPRIPEPQRGAYTHKRLRHTELFSDEGPRAADVRQGQLGDCYLLASLAAVAEADPAAIRDMVRLGRGGSYEVRFFVEGEPVWVRVDPKILQQKQRTAYAKVRDADGDMKREIWVAIVEKAYVSLNDQFPALRKTLLDGYEGIRGGYTRNTLAQITGRRAQEHDVSLLTDAQIVALLADAPLAGAETAGKKTDGIPGNHAYTLLGTRTDEDGETFIKIRNPWSHTEPGNDGTNEGVYELSLTDFRKNFARFSTCPRE